MHRGRRALLCSSPSLNPLRTLFASYWFSSSSSSSSQGALLPTTSANACRLALDVDLDLDHLPPSSLETVQVALQQGFTPSQIRTLVTKPFVQKRFLNVPHDKLASLLGLFRTRGVVGQTAGAVLIACPAILNLKVDRVRSKLEYLESLGLDNVFLVRALLGSRQISVLGMSILNLQQHIAFLKEMGMDSESICRMLRATPRFLVLNIERTLVPRVQVLQSQGMTTAEICHLLKTSPRVLMMSTKVGLPNMLQLLRHFRLVPTSTAGSRAFRAWSTRNCDTRLARFEFLKNQGFSHDEAVGMIQAQPDILNLLEETVKQKLDYLIQILKYDLHILLKCPVYLCCSLEKRIIPRFTIIKQMKEKGLLQKEPAFSSIVIMSDKKFSRCYDPDKGPKSKTV